jgi:hypothetical protein
MSSSTTRWNHFPPQKDLAGEAHSERLALEAEAVIETDSAAPADARFGWLSTRADTIRAGLVVPDAICRKTSGEVDPHAISGHLDHLRPAGERKSRLARLTTTIMIHFDTRCLRGGNARFGHARRCLYAVVALRHTC